MSKEPIIYASESGESKSIPEWSASSGINQTTLRTRIKKGMTIDEAIKASDPTMIKDPVSGEEHTIEEWSSVTGLSFNTLYNRLYVYDWPVEKALYEKKYTPVKRKPRARDTYKHMDLTGKRFGNLTVIKRDPEDYTYKNKKGFNLTEWKWICQCDCGNTISVIQHQLLDGSYVTCGNHKLRDIIDLTGRKFGFLTVINRAPDKFPNPTHDSYWYCQCDCGNEYPIVVSGKALKNGSIKTCGCGIDIYGIPETDPKIFGAYQYMLTDYYGYNPTYGENNPDAWNDNKKDFVCSEWLGPNGFNNFYSWTMNNGYKSGMKLYKRDPDGNYNTENCYWSFGNVKSIIDNGKDVIITYNGVSMTVNQWAHQLFINQDILNKRVADGWSGEDIMETPLDFDDKMVSSSIGEFHTIKEWSDLSGIDSLTLYNRIIKQNIQIDQALTLNATNPEIYKHVGPSESGRHDFISSTYGIKPIMGFGFDMYNSVFEVTNSNLKYAIAYADRNGYMYNPDEYDNLVDKFPEDFT